MIYSFSRWNLGAWHSLDQLSFNRYRASSMDLARRICIGSLGKDLTWTMTDEQVLAKITDVITTGGTPPCSSFLFYHGFSYGHVNLLGCIISFLLAWCSLPLV